MKSTETLCQAAFDGDINLIKECIKNGLDINAEGRNWNPIHAAIENEEFEAVKLLIEKGADIERVNQSMTPLSHAVDISIDGTTQSGGKSGEEPIEIIGLLLSKGAKPESGVEQAKRYQNKYIADYIIECQKQC